ncbi:hypothetical protein SAMN04490193_0581 [Pseudomonas marginalis]|uniref:hypothetical protein n=1 Tax=Pseudomonas marginalis TaxID=298 RepID=UPI00089A8AB9|nr:hypothetical protein [Pseudomonas marginalis]SEB35450.1 hypothetical protein SAMN04490193_0581 [Pseudomonas marginalis]
MSQTPPVPTLRRARIERIVNTFSSVPSLRTVAQAQIQAALDRQYPSLHYAAAHLAIGIPVGQGYRYSALADEVLARLARARPVRYVEDFHQVMQHQREVYVQGGPGLVDLERLVNHAGGELLDAWLARLRDWWGAPRGEGTSRWAELSDELVGLLYECQMPAGMSAEHFSRLFPRQALHPSRPDRTWRSQGETLTVRTLSVRRGQSTQPPDMVPVLILDHRLLGAELRTLLVFSPATGIHPLQQLEDIEPLIPGFVSASLAHGAVEWFVEELPGDPFDALAACFAQQQSAEVMAIDRSVSRTPEQCQAMLDYVTDPHRWFESALTPEQQRLQDRLPLWLIHASPDDSLAYARLLQGLVAAQTAAAGHTFLDGIAPIRTFTAQALTHCLEKEPRAKAISPDHIELTYSLVTAVMLPGGFTSGDAHRVTLTLTELALENLGGFPHAPSRIKLNGDVAPAWLSASLLTGCVTETDVGQAYPDLLRKKLIDDPIESARREKLFSRQLRAQLPLLALELKLKREGGLSQAGYRLVEAAVQASADGRAAGMWSLAFKATPAATADEVVGFYVIGPRDTEHGPHLLYRPLSTPSLREFESQQALLEAIKTPGELHDSVLAWMAPARQPVYANGGFQEPHVAHFLAGDEFSVPDRPAPAQLSKRLEEGDPLPGLFVSTAQALVSLAQAQSVSNAQQRWRTLKAGGWLLFNTLLPFVRGPALLAGWMVQVMDSVQRDVAALASNDSVMQTQGVIDLLTNLVMILAHRASPHEWPAMLDQQASTFASPASMQRPPAVILGPATVQLQPPFSWSNSRDTLTPSLRARLEGMSLKALPQPWPSRLPGAQASGIHEGLLLDTASTPVHWQALVRGHVYRVQVARDRVRVVSADGSANGPWLKSLGGGAWDVDLGLRLRGGQSDTPTGLVDSESRRQQLEQDYRQSTERRETADRALTTARMLRDSEDTRVTEQHRATAGARYVQELQNKLEASLLELECLRALQVIRRRPGYARELSTLLEGTALTLQLLLQHARQQTVAIHRRLVPLLELVQSLSAQEALLDIYQQPHRQIMEGLRQLADSNEQAIDWRGLQLGLLDELSQVPKYGRDKAQALRESELSAPTVLELQSLQVTALWAVAINTEGPTLEEGFFQSLDDTIHRARWASGSQAHLDELAPQSAELRTELLESFDRVYALSDDRIEFWRAMAPERFDLKYLEKLQQLLAQLHKEVQRELAAVLVPTAAATPAVGRARVRQKKIIRVRNQDMYVAQVKVTTGEHPQEVAEVTDAQDAVIATFTQADDGIWEPVKAPAPALPGPLPNLGRLVEQGQALRAPVEKAIAEVLKMASRANEPQSLQDLLEQRADKLRQCAEAIQQRLLHSVPERLAATQRARATTEADELRAAASRLSEQGLQARLAAIKARLPTQAGVEVLVSHHEARIFRQGARVELAGRSNDWLQAYVVMDAQTRQALCYGHFHYERPTGPDDHFTAAHLKTPAQHRMGKQSQAQARAQAFASMQAGQSGRVTQTLEIHRGEINLRMARRLFFDAPQWTGDW